MTARHDMVSGFAENRSLCDFIEAENRIIEIHQNFIYLNDIKSTIVLEAEVVNTSGKS